MVTGFIVLAVGTYALVVPQEIVETIVWKVGFNDLDRENITLTRWVLRAIGSVLAAVGFVLIGIALT